MYSVLTLKAIASELIIRRVFFSFKQCNDGYCIQGKGWDVAINRMIPGADEGYVELYIYEECSEGIYPLLNSEDVLNILEKKGLIPKG